MQRGAAACGALGRYDPGRVERMAALCGGEAPRPVHTDESSILFLDREPLRWQGARGHGLAWLGTDAWNDTRPDDWKGAARAGANGLVIEGRKRFLHSSVSGLAPLYWLDDGGATYFCSRLDPLVRAAGRRFSLDWEAWAAIIALRFPLGQRTPFAEVRRLEQFATLGRRLGRGRSRSHRWPWAEVEPLAGLDAAADAAVEGMRQALAGVPAGVVCPLSGGRDSRMLCAILAADGRAGGAITAADDEGEAIEEDLAAAVAGYYGLPHERLAGAAADYRADWEERARRVEHQFVDHAWLMPAVRRLEGDPAPLPDGFGIDIFVQSERHFNPPEALYATDGRAAALALLEALRRYGATQMALAPEFREPLLERVRDQFLAAVRPLEGHPSQNVLSVYATRSRRGVGSYAAGLWGDGGQVLAPGAGDEVVCATLSASQREKDDGRLYEAIFARIAPDVGRLPSTTNTARSGPALPRRWRSQPALEMHRELLAEGPLAPHLSAELRAWLERPGGAELPGDLRLGMEGVSLLHSWWRRYRDLLSPTDATALRG